MLTFVDNCYRNYRIINWDYPKMWRLAFCFLIACLLHCVSGFDGQLCNDKQQITSCNKLILGQDRIPSDSCKLEFFSLDSPECKKMNYSSLSSNTQMGGIMLKPYVLYYTKKHSENYTILNITFVNIKWKTMRFNILGTQNKRNQCRKIEISNDVTINDQSILYYDCMWLPANDKRSENYTLHFEATDGNVNHTGRYYFHMPSYKMLGAAVKETEWKPFIYIEMLIGKLRLHVVPPLSHLNITAYRIEVLKKCHINVHNNMCKETVQSAILNTNSSEEVTYDFDYRNGEYSALYHFEVTPVHTECEIDEEKCQTTESPIIFIDIPEPQTICIVTVTALVVASVFALYLLLRLGTRYFCVGVRPHYGNGIPAPTKILAVYPLTNRYHAKCVASFINYLRSELGFDVTHYPDINNSTNRDPQKWAIEAFANTTHFMYIVGPGSDYDNKFYTNTYGDNIYAHFDPLVFRNLDGLLLSYLQQTRAVDSPKNVLNVYFEYSNGPLPDETFYDKKFFLLKDWHKLIDHLSKNLLPKKQIMRTANGQCFLDDLNSAKQLLAENDRQHV